MRSFASQVSLVLLLFLFATTFNKGICDTVGKEVRCNENDKKILLIFREGVVDHSTNLPSWTSEEDCCLWERVYCDNFTGRVTKLDLSKYWLEGVINLSLLELQFLNYLDLSYNNFTSVCIPPCQISKFHLNGDNSNNQSFATSYIPSGNFSASLHYLDISKNYHFLNNDDFLSLNDLRWLSQLSSLKYLNLSGINIGSDPKWLKHVAMLPSLFELRLSSCGLRDFPSFNYVNFTSLRVLDLSYNNISSLPDSFFNVTKDISSIELDYNNFYGKFPIAFFKLPNLNYLSLSHNKFVGSIPSFVGNLASLTVLDLSNNYFSGSLPVSLGQLHRLTYLSITGNSWTGVLSERNFANLTSLTTLYLSSTNFKFDFDPNWVPPFQLNYFDSTNTSLGLNFPAWLYRQNSLESLWLSKSMISNIDADLFWSFTARIYGALDLSNNFISGDISNVTLHSTYIRLEYNNFSGGLPHISENVHTFHASHNSFSGSISSFLCHLQSNGESMVILDLSYNYLSGILPDFGANWRELTYLNLRSNKLTGSLPNFRAERLLAINLRTNQFTGDIPSQLCNLSSLKILDLAENKLSGSIPHCQYNLTTPSVVWSDVFFEMIEVSSKGRDLDYNFSRVLYSQSGVIDLSVNVLSGEIPKELFGTSQMQTLNLSQNQLTGNIPKEIRDMRNLESLDLSYNRLSGEIPSVISNLSFLAYLNLSYNDFNGKIPLGTQIQSFDSWSFVGNHKLCGDPLSRKCNNKEETRDDLKLAEGNEDKHFLKSLYLGMGVGFVVGFWGVCSSLFFIRVWRHKFFRWFGHMLDQLFVAWTLCFNRFS